MCLFGCARSELQQHAGSSSRTGIDLDTLHWSVKSKPLAHQGGPGPIFGAQDVRKALDEVVRLELRPEGFDEPVMCGRGRQALV